MKSLVPVLVVVDGVDVEREREEWPDEGGG